MTDNPKSSRRSFFLHGGAVLSAGVATTAGAAAPADLRQQLAGHDDREAIRRLQLDFMSSMEHQAYESVAALFSDQARFDLSGLTATGQAAIGRALVAQYRTQRATTMHSAYRQNGSQRKDVITLHRDAMQATATFHTEVELSTPLRADSTAAQMARLQGQMAIHRWESGRFDAQYEKSQGLWRIAALSYSSLPGLNTAKAG
jgi:hypothetical protein